MAVSAIDSRLFRNLFGTQEIREAFTDESYARCMIDTETGLARSQSKVGVIPAEAGKVITKTLENIELEYIRPHTTTYAGKPLTFI